MPLDPDSAEVRYSRMLWNTPLSEGHARLLLGQLEGVGGNEVLDLGCGWGELLLRALADLPAATGVGVDSSTSALARGRRLAAERGLSERVRFMATDASKWTAAADRILCTGASHAWGGTAEALQALALLVRPGGRVLFGDGCWEGPPPSEAAVAMFGEEVLPLREVVDRAARAGWRIIHLSTADQGEWDNFESTYRAGREEWVLANPQHDRASQVRAELDSQLRDYVDVYRGVLGFVYLVLSR